MFTERFCDEFVAEAEHFGGWSDGTNKDSRLQASCVCDSGFCNAAFAPELFTFGRRRLPVPVYFFNSVGILHANLKNLLFNKSISYVTLVSLLLRIWCGTRIEHCFALLITSVFIYSVYREVTRLFLPEIFT